MSADDWRRVIHEAASMGVDRVQFIGGEPTLHPQLPELARHALALRLEVEVFSNLARSIPEELWELFGLPSMMLATSYYSDVPIEHDAVTGRRGSHALTLANIREALRRGVALRAGVIAVEPRQRSKEAVEQLRALGVMQIDHDDLRQLGRGVRDMVPRQVSQLCGGCGDRRLAVSPDGEVWPCPMTRWMSLGNVAEASLGSIYDASSEQRRLLQAELHVIRGDDDGGCAAPLCCNPHLGK